MQHLHTEYEREPVPLFVKVQRDTLERKLNENAGDCFEVVSRQLLPQLLEKGRLLWVQGFTLRAVFELIPTRHPDPAVSTAYCLDGVRTHERRNVIADRPRTDIELTGKVVVCILPPLA